MGRPDTSSARRRGLAGFLARNLSSLFARFRQANGDCLLSASHSSALPAFARSQGSVFATPHGAGHALLRTRSVSRHFSASFADPTLAGNTAATAVRPNFLYASPGASSEVSVGSLRKAYERGYLRGFVTGHGNSPNHQAEQLHYRTIYGRGDLRASFDRHRARRCPLIRHHYVGFSISQPWVSVSLP